VQNFLSHSGTEILPPPESQHKTTMLYKYRELIFDLEKMQLLFVQRVAATRHRDARTLTRENHNEK
jgi:hypothetical protein